MSSWPEAVWIVKKLQRNFDFSSQITFYTNNLNTLNDRILQLNSNVVSLEGQIDTLDDSLNAKVSSFVAKNNGTSANPIPNVGSSTTFAKGTIWFVSKT